MDAMNLLMRWGRLYVTNSYNRSYLRLTAVIDYIVEGDCLVQKFGGSYTSVKGDGLRWTVSDKTRVRDAISELYEEYPTEDMERLLVYIRLYCMQRGMIQRERVAGQLHKFLGVMGHRLCVLAEQNVVRPIYPQKGART